MHIEVLAKELELYKAKSAGEVQRKISALEFRSKAEAKSLRLENQLLKETAAFKEEKITELQQEIERLRMIVKMDASQTKKEETSRPSNTVLEKRLEEVASRGKLEYRIYAASKETSAAASKSFKKLLSLSQPSLMQALTLQAKLLDQKETVRSKARKGHDSGDSKRAQPLENEIARKFKELGKERTELETLLNKVLSHERKLQINFDSLNTHSKRRQYLKVKDDWKTSLKYSAEDEEKVGLSHSPISSVAHAAAKDVGPEVQVAPGLSLAAMSTLNKLIDEGRLTEATDDLRKSNYEFDAENIEEVVQKLILACKVKDKQLANLKSSIGRKETVSKCMQLHEDEINTLLNEYEEMREKYCIEPGGDEHRLKQELEQQVELNGDLSEELNECKSELARLKTLEEESEKAIKELEEENEILGKQLKESQRVIAKLQSRKMEEERKLKDDSETEKELSENQEIIAELEETNKFMAIELEEQKNAALSLEENNKRVSKELEKNKKVIIKLEGINKDLKDQLEAKEDEEKEKNEEIKKIRQKLYEMEQTNASMVNEIEELQHRINEAEKINSEEPVNELDIEIGNTLPVYSHLLSQFEDINLLIEEYRKSASVAGKLLGAKTSKQSELKKALCNQGKLNERLIAEFNSITTLLTDLASEHAAALNKLKQTSSNTKAAAKTLNEFLLDELQNARQISFMLSTPLLTAKDPTLSQEALNKCQSNTENIRAAANDIYKDFFMNIKSNSMTGESLVRILNESGNKFRELYKLYEKVLELNSALVLSHIASMQRFENQSTKEEAQDHNIEKLLREMKGLREIVSFQRTAHPQKLTAEQVWKEKAELLEGKLQAANSKLQECEDKLVHAMEATKKRSGNEQLRASIPSKETPDYNINELEEKLAHAREELDVRRRENKELQKANAQLVKKLNESTLSRRSLSKVQSGTIHKNTNVRTPNKYTSLFTVRNSNSGSLKSQKHKAKALRTSLHEVERPLYASVERLSTAVEPKEFAETEEWDAETIREPAKFIEKVFAEVYGEEMCLSADELDFKKFKEIIYRACELIRKLKHELEIKSQELERVDEMVQRERCKQGELSRNVLVLKASLDKTSSEKQFFKIQLGNAKTVSRRHACKSKLHLLILVGKDRLEEEVLSKEHKSLEATKKGKNYALELEETLKLLKAYREELEQCKRKIDRLTVQKAGLEECNSKASTEIRALLETHQADRSTQAQLVAELEALRAQLSLYKKPY